MTQDPEGRGADPDWLDPRNDRKTPYSEQEVELFVEGFISSMDDVADWNQMVKEIGEVKAREVLKEGFRRMDPNGPIKVVLVTEEVQS